uniref:Transmembrane protein 135 N-terminal domain-containing protein n=1 Tax=Acrobeloides nanus TaxID=290746 RepID=A0A914EK82_9BILA
MTALSKFFRQTLGLELLTANCHEYCHVWNPNCRAAVFDACKDGFPFCLKTYAAYYLITSLFRKKDPKKIDYKQLVKDVLRSSVFLTMNMFWFLFLMCRMRIAVARRNPSYTRFLVKF